jgi:hypothetical protein
MVGGYSTGEGLWQQLKGVELRHVCCFTIAHLRDARRQAVKRVRRKPRLIRGCFQEAGFQLTPLWS